MIVWLVVLVPLIIAAGILVWAICDAASAGEEQSLAYAEYVAREHSRPLGNVERIY